jgi:monoamine oxidase
VYATPFWRGDGLSGLAVSDTGAVALSFDATPGAAPQGVGVLVAFVSEAGCGASPPARRAAIVAGVRALFGPGAAHPLAFVETRWAQEPLTAGCVSPLAPGVLTRGGAALRAPIGSLHFAGTETSPVWCGYLEGAVRAGRRAAAEVDAALG